jgi:hypothetical protein
MATVPTTISPSAAIASYFERPLLLSTENRKEYEAMFKALAAMLKPQDEFEWFLVGDYLHENLQIRRWRKAETAIIEMTRKDALRAALESALEGEDRSHLIDGYIEAWFKDDEGKLSVLEVLGRRGLDERHITAHAMTLRLSELDKIQRMIGDSVHRRAASVQELEFYRIAASWRAPKDLPALVDAAAAAIPIVPTTEANCPVKAP